jgi:ABC-type multidrug transport system ATPase subunit
VERGDIPEFKGLTCHYGDLVTFDHLSFTVAEEWMFGFAGRNGAGKATTMRIMLGCWSPTPATSTGADNA